MTAAHAIETAPGEQTLPQHAGDERFCTPPPTDFRHPCFARMGPPKQADRSARVRLPVLGVRPDAGVHKRPTALRPLGHLRPLLLDFSAAPQTSCHAEADSYLRLCITQRKAQEPSRTCNERKEEEEAFARLPSSSLPETTAASEDRAWLLVEAGRRLF